MPSASKVFSKSFIVLLGTTADLSAQITELIIDANSVDEAIEVACCRYPNLFLHDCQQKRNPWGGARPGSGQPSKYGEKTKVVRVPESVADKRDLIAAIPELIELLDELEADCKNNPDSARRYFLRQAISEIRSLGF